MRADLEIDCDSEFFKKSNQFLIIWMVIFIFGVPFYILYLLGKRKDKSEGIIQSLYYGILLDEY